MVRFVGRFHVQRVCTDREAYLPGWRCCIVANRITAVDWGGVTRVTSGGNSQHLPIEIFRLAVDRILLCGWISREEINQHFPRRGSSGIVLILREVPLFEWTANPTGLRLRARR